MTYLSSSRILFFHISDFIENLIACRIIFCLVLKGELLESSKLGDMAHKPAYFVPGKFQYLIDTISFLKFGQSSEFLSEELLGAKLLTIVW